MRLFLWLTLALASLGWAPLAAAASSPNCTASSATLSLPSSISILPNAPTGPISGATGTATITFNCSGLPATTSHSADYTAVIQAGQYLATLDTTNNVNGPGITFATNITGLALLVTATPVQATSNACLACGPTSTAGYVPGSVVAPSSSKQGAYSGTVTANYTGQLVKTIAGAISPGTITAINLIPFWWYIPGGSVDSTSLTLNASLNLGAITVTVPACTISSGSNFTVTLPTVTTSALSASGKIAGTTPFSISLSGCPSGVSVATSVFSGGNVDAATGNLKNGGVATNVEVQLLNGSGSSNAAAYSAINLSQTTASTQNSGLYNIVGNAAKLNYYAQYYAIGAATAGSVQSSVQYTITYQ
jgi:type 1 fimbria pilin